MMGEYATGLSTVELDEVNVDSVITNLDQIGLISWDKAQVSHRTEWGDTSGTFAGLRRHIWNLVWTKRVESNKENGWKWP